MEPGTRRRRDLARRLIAAQCFEPTSLRLLGEGWDNTVWLADERWAFRFPRREIGLPGFRRELAVLGELSSPRSGRPPRSVLAELDAAERIPAPVGLRRAT